MGLFYRAPTPDHTHGTAASHRAQAHREKAQPTAGLPGRGLCVCEGFPACVRPEVFLSDQRPMGSTPALGVSWILMKTQRRLRQDGGKCVHEASGLAFTESPSVSSWCRAQASFPRWRAGSLRGSQGWTHSSFQRESGPSRFYSPGPNDLLMLDGGGSDTRDYICTDVRDTDNGWSHSGGHEEPAARGHHRTQTHGMHSRSAGGAGGGGGAAPAPVSTVRASPQHWRSFRQGLSLGERGWGAVHQRPPQAVMGA